MKKNKSGSKNKPLIDVVITFAGRFDMLEKCLDAIYADATVPISISIVDDNSPKDEKLHFKHLFEYDKEKDVHGNVVAFYTRRNEKQEGFPRSANAGAKNARSNYIAFISDDVEIHRGYFDKILQLFDERKEIGIIGSKLMFQPTSTHRDRPAGKIQHVGVSLDIRANPVHPLVGWSPDNPKTCISREAFAVTGALYAIRSELFRKFGGFDLIYGLGYWEDMDLCLKVRSKGYTIWFEAETKAYHYVAASAEKGVVHNTNFQQNSMIFKARWGRTGFLVADGFTYG